MAGLSRERATATSHNASKAAQARDSARPAAKPDVKNSRATTWRPAGTATERNVSFPGRVRTGCPSRVACHPGSQLSSTRRYPGSGLAIATAIESLDSRR